MSLTYVVKGARTGNLIIKILYCLSFYPCFFQRDLDFTVTVDFDGELSSYHKTSDYRMR